MIAHVTESRFCKTHLSFVSIFTKKHSGLERPRDSNAACVRVHRREGRRRPRDGHLVTERREKPVRGGARRGPGVAQHEAAPPLPMPAKAAQLVGEYYLNATVWIQSSSSSSSPNTNTNNNTPSPSPLLSSPPSSASSMLLARVFGATYRLTPLSAAGEAESSFYPVRVHSYPAAVGLDAECRWLDDGSDTEIMYFDLGGKESKGSNKSGGSKDGGAAAAATAAATGLTFMGSKLNRV